jgi:uncharacterized protein (DUF2249 family)
MREERTAVDVEGALVALLLEGARELADAGRPERASQVAAAAWSTVEPARPDLAAKLTAALHGLTRRVAGDPVTLVTSPAGDAVGATDPKLDVRSLAPAQRHEAIFEAYGVLPAGAGFVLVNDHDPKPLRYQFAAEHDGEFTWDVLESGPEVWRVRIGRPPAPSRAPSAVGEDDEPELDVRPLVHARRHDAIFTAFGALSPGAGFVLVNDHDPRPLRFQFEAQHPGRFTWDYVESGPRTWRVRIGRVREGAL